MKRTEEFCNLPKAELILYFTNYLPVKLFNCSFADLSKYSWFNRRFLLPWTLFRTFSSPRNGYNSMHNTKRGVIKKKMIYQSFWQMVFPVLRINAVGDTICFYDLSREGYSSSSHGTGPQIHKKNCKRRDKQGIQKLCLDLQAKIFAPLAHSCWKNWTYFASFNCSISIDIINIYLFSFIPTS